MTEEQSPVPQSETPALSIQAAAPGRGVAWFSEGLNLFKREPVLLGAIGLIALVIYAVVSLIPILNFFALALFWPHLSAGMYFAARHAYDQQSVSVGDLFEPFKSRMEPLLGVGGLYIGGFLVILVVMGIIAAVSFDMATLQQAMEHEPGQPMPAMTGAMSGIMIMVLLGLALMIPLAMAFLFAPLLVHQGRQPALEAVKSSFEGCLKNIVPFLIWGLVWFAVCILIAILAMIPVVGWILGLLFMAILGPLMATNLLIAFFDIFKPAP